MKLSYNWLQSYFDEKLPSPEKIADMLTMHAFEVESVEEHGGDFVLDVDVLPNRAHDCLSHRGVAKEIAALLDLPRKRDPLRPVLPDFNHPLSRLLKVEIRDAALCRRYSAAVVEGVRVGESPNWLKERLAAVGQHSINNIVDITNYVMFDTGQPLHAFDLNKIKNAARGPRIVVRSAEDGETMQALDGETYTLAAGILVIADDDAPIGIAGVKGGAASGIDEATTAIVLESANFDPASVRRTSRALSLPSDAAKRFENEISPSLTMHALDETVKYIKEEAGGKVEGFSDTYPGRHAERVISITTNDVNALLGTGFGDSDVEGVFRRLGFAYRKKNRTYSVIVPEERLDLAAGEDIAEEVGRVIGYDAVRGAQLPDARRAPAVDKHVYYENEIRRQLAEEGFSEVYTYAFRDAGETALANPLAGDKAFLRKSLVPGLRRSIKQNVKYTDLFGLPEIKIFEIGNVFTKGGERAALGIATSDKKTNSVRILDGDFAVPAEGILEIDLDELIDQQPQPDAYSAFSTAGETQYKPISPYPFVLRDIALWAPKGIKNQKSKIKETIENTAGELLVRADLFDEFEKEEHTSYAFHLVFQSPERTLTDEEVNAVIERVSAALSASGWQVR